MKIVIEVPEGVEIKVFRNSEESSPIQETVVVDDCPEEFFIKSKRVNSSGYMMDGGFTVTGGSIAVVEESQYLQKYASLLRQELLSRGILQEKNDYLVFTESYHFNSPSAAACVVLGRSSSGLAEWRTYTGVPLRKAIRGSSPEATSPDIAVVSLMKNGQPKRKKQYSNNRYKCYLFAILDILKRQNGSASSSFVIASIAEYQPLNDFDQEELASKTLRYVKAIHSKKSRLKDLGCVEDNSESGIKADDPVWIITKKGCDLWGEWIDSGEFAELSKIGE
jgi:hypothetical protein